MKNITKQNSMVLHYFWGAPGGPDLKTWIANEPESTMHVDSKTASCYHSGRTSSWHHAAQAKRIASIFYRSREGFEAFKPF